jgi:hypothetical protein
MIITCDEQQRADMLEDFARFQRGGIITQDIGGGLFLQRF